MLVDRRRAGDDDRLRLGPDQRRDERPQLLAEGEPGRIRAEPAVDAERFPLLEGRAASRPRRRGRGVPASSRRGRSAPVAGESAPGTDQGISGVEGQRFRFAAVDDGGDRFRRHASPLLPSPVRLPHCRTPYADDRVGTREAWRGIAQGNSTLWCGVNAQAHGGNTKRAGSVSPALERSYQVRLDNGVRREIPASRGYGRRSARAPAASCSHGRPHAQ